MKVASRTGHSSFYVEKGRQVLGKSANELGKFGLCFSLSRLLDAGPGTSFTPFRVIRRVIFDFAGIGLFQQFSSSLDTMR